MIYKLCLVLSIGFAGVGYAQKYSTSPFSTQGIGEAGGLEDSQFGAYGNCRTAIMDTATVNIYNPSSYTALAKGQPLFAIGMSSRFSRYTTGSNTYNGQTIGLNQITMVLPFGKRFGMAIGLQPFSRKGYSIEQKVLVGSDTVRNIYKGNGTTQQILGGLAYKFLDIKRHQASVGLNYSYIFGSVTDERQVSFIAYEPIGGLDQLTYRLHGGQLSVGMNYAIMLDTMKNQYLRLAAVFTPEQKLSAHRDYFHYTSTDISNPNVYDTLSSNTNDKGSIVYPASYSIGLNYSFRPRVTTKYSRKNVYQINIYADYSSTRWSDYQTQFSTEDFDFSLANSQRFSFGMQYTPNYESYAKSIGTSYFNRVRYRAGTYFGSLPNLESGKQLKEFGVSFGFGLPIASQKTNSTFNFSVQYGQRGNNEPSGLQEQFIGFNFGVILAPASYDKWFKKYKLD